MNIIDLAAIVPFYAWLAMSDISFVRTLGVLRTVRLVRLFRIFKLGRYSSGLQLMMTALRNSSQAALVLSFFLGIGIVLFSSLIYYVEKMGCPDRDLLGESLALDGSNRTQLQHYEDECHSKARTSQYALCCDKHDAPLDFPNIIEAFWWSIVTMTTVGFGDVSPKTGLGRMVGTVTMLSGILLIALPIAIIGRKFQEAYDAHMQERGFTKEKDMQKGTQRDTSLNDMGRRLRLMPLHGELGVIAKEMAAELDVLSEMQEEIVSMQNFEKEKQKEVINNFDYLLGVLLDSTERKSAARKATMAFSTGKLFKAK